MVERLARDDQESVDLRDRAIRVLGSFTKRAACGPSILASPTPS
jgi:hypothetical protein